jgi:uncharacterized protein (TIGR03067 family)
MAPPTTLRNETNEAIAWGEPKDGVRIGLAPTRVEVPGDARNVAVTLWYHSVAKEERKVQIFQDGNVSPVMFAAGSGDKVMVDFIMDRLAQSLPQFVTLKPGQRFSEVIRIPFQGQPGVGFINLPRPQAGQPVTLRAGLATKHDARGKETWEAAETRHSGSITIALTTGLLMAADDPSKDDLEKLRGTWLTVSLVDDGKTIVDEKTPPKERAATKLAYEGNKWVIKVGDKAVASGVFKIDATRTPREIDILDESGEKNEKTKLGIYELTGDTYKFCLAPAGKPRPKEFASKAGSGHSLGVSTREKP